MSKTETKSTVLLKHHLKALKLPTILAEAEKIAQRYPGPQLLRRRTRSLRGSCRIENVNYWMLPVVIPSRPQFPPESPSRVCGSHGNGFQRVPSHHNTSPKCARKMPSMGIGWRFGVRFPSIRAMESPPNEATSGPRSVRRIRRTSLDSVGAPTGAEETSSVSPASRTLYRAPRLIPTTRVYDGMLLTLAFVISITW